MTGDDFQLSERQVNNVRATVQSFLRANVYGDHRDAAAMLIVGVSGGPDSLALLHVLVEGELYPSERMVVAHLNHRLRPSSTADAQFVARLCAELGVSCVIEEQDVATIARSEGMSLEEAGRVVRYRFLGEVARRYGAEIVAVGHNADDQAETVLMHILRGTGMTGLRGIEPVAAFPGSPDLQILRPLLNITREAIETYCETHQLTPVIDSSNVDPSFFRNRLRHELLPMLADYNPQIKERLQNMAEVVRADESYLNQLALNEWNRLVLERGTGWVRVDLTAWQSQPLSLRRRILRHAVQYVKRSMRNVGFMAVELAREVAERGDVGRTVTLPGNLIFTVEYEAWRLALHDVELPIRYPQLTTDAPIPLNTPARLELANGWVLETWLSHELDVEDVYSPRNPWVAYIDADAAGEVLVRSRIPGERFQPLGMAGHSAKLSDVMINEKLPRRLRDEWPLVANQDHLVWLVGFQIDERVRVAADTKAILCLSCHNVRDIDPDPEVVIT